ncbi:MAG: hypothetical protein QX189_01895 [Methylococcales bacterium]
MEWTKELDSRHSGDVLRLINLLDDGKQFCLLLAEYNNAQYRDQVIDELASQYPEQAIISAANTDDLISTLQETPSHASVLHIIDTQQWFDNHTLHSIVLRLNQRRDWLAQHVNRGMVFWLSAAHINAFSHAAPDLWAWRKAVVDFCNYAEDKPTQAIYSQRLDENSTDYPDKQQRLTEISDYLASKNRYSLADAALWHEKSRILISIADYDAAVISIQQALGIYQDYNDKRATAVSYGDLADVLEARGDLDGALKIRREEELPVYEALGDKRSLLVGQTNLALLLQKIDAKHHATEIQALLTQALRSAEQMNIPEQAIIRRLLQSA